MRITEILKNILKSHKDIILHHNSSFVVSIYTERCEIDIHLIDEIRVYIKNISGVVNTLHYTVDHIFIDAYDREGIVQVSDDIKLQAGQCLFENSYLIWLMLQYEKVIKIGTI